MNRFSLVLLLLVLVVGLVLQGCVSDTTTPVTAPQTKVAPAQRATITGKIIDGCTNYAIAGAVLSFGNDGSVNSTTSDASGSFAFANVPVGQYTTVNGSTVFSGTYTLTASMVNYNKGQADSTKRYRPYYYNTVTITFTSVQDSTGLLGLVGAINFVITNTNTMVEGSVVDVNMRPVPNAQVILYDQSINPGTAMGITRTNANGIYTFTNVDNGLVVSIAAKSADGVLQGNLGPFALPCNVPFDSLRAQYTPERVRILAIDNVAPYVIGLTPENKADVSATSMTVVYTFSEPIKQTAYTRTDLGLGHGTIMDAIHVGYSGMKKTTADIGFTAAWDPTFTVFTITPQGLVGSAKYTVDATAAFTSGNLKDAAGNAVVNNATIVGDFEVLNFTTAGGTAGPTAPTLVRRSVPGVFDPLDYAGGTVGLEWNYDATVRSYNVYRSVNGGSYDLLANNITVTRYQTTAPGLYTGSSPNPLGYGNVAYKVTAVSKDLVEGSASNVVTVTDAVKPKLIYFPAPAAAPGTNNWVYTIGFSEPMSQSASENIANYTMSSFGGVSYTINSATYAGFDGTRWVVYLYVTSSAAPVAGYALTATSAVVDLAGNSMDTAANSHTY